MPNPTHAPWTNGGGSRTFGPSHGVDQSRENMGGSTQPSTHTSGTGYKQDSYGDILQKTKGFLGVPNTSLYNKSQHYETELDTYPDSYTDALITMGYGSKDQPINNRHVAQVILEKTNAHQCFPITRCAPWEQHDQSMTIEWSHLRFTQHVLDRLPELAMARLVSRTQSSGSASMSRYGIAMLLEATFMTTPQGKRTYKMIIEQMHVATITTACTAILVAILTHQPYEAENLEGVVDQADSTSAVGINKIFQAEKYNTACMNKRGGADKLLQEMRKTLAIRGVTNANFCVIPGGSAATFSRDSTDHSNIVNDETDETVESSKSRGMTIIQSLPRAQGHGSPHWDPYKRRRAYGSYFTLDAENLENEKPLNYKTNMMSKTVYDENSDTFQSVSYTYYRQRTGLYHWDRAGMPLTSQQSELGHGWARDNAVYTWGQAIRKFMLPHWQRHLIPIIRDRCRTMQQRRAFFQSFRLLPKGSEELKGDDSYPDERDFKMQNVVRACGPNAKLDDTYTVGEYRDVAAGRADPNNSRNQRIKRHLHQLEADRDPNYTNEEIFHMNDDPDPAKIVQLESYRRDGDFVLRVPGSTVEARYVHRKFKAPTRKDAASTIRKELKQAKEALFAAAQAVPPSAADAARWKARADAANALVDANARKAALAAALAQKNAEILNLYAGAWPSAIDAAAGMDDEAKLTAYKDLKQFAADAALYVQHQVNTVANLNGADGQEVSWARGTVIDILMGRAYGPSDVERGIKSLTGDANKMTPLERLSMEQGGIASDPPAAALTHLKWTPDQSSDDDGQVHVVERRMLPGTAHSLPADAYAATLAYPGKVVLLSNEDDDLSLFSKLSGSFGKPIRKDRKQALMWSILVSHVFRALTYVDASPISNSSELAAALAASMASLDVIEEPPTDGSLTPEELAAATSEYERNPDKPPINAILLAYAKKVAEADVHLPLSQAPFTSAVAILQRAILVKLLADAPGLANGNPQQQSINGAASTVLTSLAVTPLQTEFGKHLKKLDLVVFDSVVQSVKDNARPADESDVPRPPSGSELPWTDAAIQDALDRGSITSGAFWAWCDFNDVPVPFFLKCVRPRKVYEMGSAHMQVADANVGAAKTFFQMPHMMMGADPGPKLVYGNYTCYFAPVVTNPERIIVMPDVYVCGYVGGNGLDVNDPNIPDHVAAWSAGKGASVFVLAIPMVDFRKCSHPWMSITGALPANIPCDQDVQQMLRYPGCDAFARFWGFHGNPLRAANKGYVTNISQRELSQNTVCFQDMQAGWDVAKQQFNKLRLNEGHFGKYACYPGAAEVTNGRVPHFDPHPACYDNLTSI